MITLHFTPYFRLSGLQFGMCYIGFRETLKKYTLEPNEKNITNVYNEKVYLEEFDITTEFTHQGTLAFIEYFYDPLEDFTINYQEISLTKLIFREIETFIYHIDKRAFINNEETLFSPLLGLGVAPVDDKNEFPESLFFFQKDYFVKSYPSQFKN